MNFKLVFKLTGRVLIVEACSMVLPLLVSLYYDEDPLPFLLSMGILLAGGYLLSLLRAEKRFYAREGFFTVGLIWLLLGVFGALPFQFSGYFGSFANCVFESISGFTTTGSTILSDIQSLPRGILFWRSETQWLGGMGVLVLTAALLPSLGESSKYLTRTETPGPVKSKLVPKSSQSSRILYAIYCVLTMVELLLLRCTGMGWYDCAVCAMSTTSTGGFGVLNSSIAGYANPAAEVIITVFMLLSGINFSIYFLLLTGRFRQVLKSDELRFFLVMVALAVAAITANIASLCDSLGQALRLAAFQVISIVTTTGFITANYELWPGFSVMILVVLMFTGACAGSTSGGMKCARILLILRNIRQEMQKILHPASVNIIRLDGQVVEERLVHNTATYIGTYFGLLLTGCILISLENQSFATSFTAVLSALSNIGPGLDAIGPVYNHSFFSAPTKLLLSLYMIVGRLEIFPILILFSRKAWKKY